MLRKKKKTAQKPEELQQIPKEFITEIDSYGFNYEELPSTLDESGRFCKKILVKFEPYLVIYLYPNGMTKLAGTTKSGNYYSNEYELISECCQEVKNKLEIWNKQGI